MTPEATALDQRIKQLGTELAATPVEEGRRSPTLGYHSQITDRPDVTKWVQVDLGSTRAIDEVILVPAHVVYGGHPGPGFGFPPRFRVEISDDPDFARATVVADHTQTDFANPGDLPVRIATAGKAARFVRVTATRLWKRTGDWCLALAEMVVLVGQDRYRSRRRGQCARLDRGQSQLGTGQSGRWLQQSRAVAVRGRRRADASAAIGRRNRQARRRANAAARVAARRRCPAADDRRLGATWPTFAARPRPCRRSRWCLRPRTNSRRSARSPPPKNRGRSICSRAATSAARRS